MNSATPSATRHVQSTARTGDDGFTLIELLIAIVLSGLIAGVVVAALLTSTNIARSTGDAVNDSNDAGLIAAFLYRDAQSAGVTDPATALADPTAGVSTSNTVAGWAGCGQAAPLVIRFSWVDRTQSLAGTKVVVTYALDSTTGQLTRRTCIGTTATLVPVGNHVSSATATCQPTPDCSNSPSTVSLAVIGSALGQPFTYTLTASLRRLDQQPPSTTNSSPVPLIVLGDSTSGKPCPNLTLGGTGVVHVIGDAVVDTSCTAPGTPVSGTGSLLQPTGSLSSFAGVADPFAGLAPPAYTCGSGVNPPVGQSSGPSAVVVYPQAVSVTASTSFQPGRYVFCAGLSFTGGTISGVGVQWYVAGGALSIGAGATLDVSPVVSGALSEPLIWVAGGAATAVSIAAGGHVDNLRGMVYAPRATLQLSSVGGLDLGGAIAREVTISGPGQVRFGMPVPVLTVAPSTLPAAEVGVAYGATLTVAGASAPVTWTATGLPPGIAMNAASGLISGTPTGPGTYPVTATLIDGTGAGISVDMTLSIAPPLVFTGPANLSAADVGLAYPAVTMTATGGVMPLAWSSTGMPPGIVIDPVTGVVSGTPTTSGSYNAVVQVSDAAGGMIATTYTIVVNPALQITTSVLPGGQAGIAYPPTTMTASGGTSPINWSATGLPNGMTIAASTGVVSGTPTAAGTFSVVLTATDALGQPATATVPLSIAPPASGCPGVVNGWLGEYYANQTLSGNPTVCRDDAAINFDWGTGSPAAGIPSDHFSARWTRTENFAAGTYLFTMGSDDGGRLYVDGALVLDQWVDQAYPGVPPSTSVSLVAGTHSIVMAYYENGGLAQATLTYSAQVTPPACLAAAAGWLGEYYSNLTLTGTPTSCRDDAAINFDWSTGSPGSGLPVDRFGVRWTRTSNFAGGDYLFTMGSDDGGRLYIDGVLVLDRWFDQAYPASPPTTVQHLTAGNHTIVMEYYENGGYARATLTYVQQVVPPACFVAPAGWLGEYYSAVDLSGVPAMCRDDVAINFDWGSGAPASGMPSDNFSVRWRRTTSFTAGTHRFTMGSDDGSRLYIDGNLVLDRWWDQGYPSPPPWVDVNLAAGNHTIIVEYYERGGAARATLAWT